jgi:signal peptidase II
MTKASKQIGKIPLKYLILMILTSLVIGFDQLTKSMVLAQFGLGATLPVLDHFFNLTYVQNRGAAFGFLAQANPSFRVPFFMIVPFIALVSIGLVFRKLPHDDRRHSSALSLVTL